MGIRKIGLSLLAIGLSNAAVLAHAVDLNISNNTDKFVTSLMNGWICSNMLPNGAGITKPWEQNHLVPSSAINTACWRYETACKAEIYASQNCTGEKIATAVLNVKTGSITIPWKSPSYKIVQSGFSFALFPA